MDGTGEDARPVGVEAPSINWRPVGLRELGIAGGVGWVSKMTFQAYVLAFISQRGAMSTTTIIVVIVAIIIVAVLFGAAMMAEQNRRRRRLRTRFGPEYDRTVNAAASPKEAEQELRGRLDRRDRLVIQPLSAAQRDRYQQDWRQVQGVFVDEPTTALGQADALVTHVMADRGYPMEDFDQQAELVSVDHPGVVENYRRAHGVYVARESRAVGVEDMRQAFVSYRALFSELVDSDQATVDTR